MRRKSPIEKSNLVEVGQLPEEGKFDIGMIVWLKMGLVEDEMNRV